MQVFGFYCPGVVNAQHAALFLFVPSMCFAPQPVSVDWRRASALKVLFEQMILICWKRVAVDRLGGSATGSTATWDGWGARPPVPCCC